MIGQIFNHYRITEKLGAGGMGVVYLAEDTRLQREVAIKFLPAKQTQDEESKTRLIREARSASALNHPNVCTIHSFEEFKSAGNNQTEHFIVMEFVSGLTLREKNREGPLKIYDAVNYAIQIAEALKEAHGKGIVHLDIKSDNIMINSQNQVKVMDFGLARLKDSREEPLSGSTFGTAAYMSPEQAMGKPAGFASDIWSFGIVLYEMLTGKLPFIHNYEAAVIYSIINEEPLPPSCLREDINPDLEQVILTCLQKEAEKRYESSGKIITALKKIRNELEPRDIRETLSREKTSDLKRETEQKQAAIVFMKLAGYSELMDKAGHENIVPVIEEYSKIISEITQKYGGTIKKIDGPDIVLFFGLPVSIENSSQKAVHAAIEIADTLLQSGRKNSPPADLTLNIGINTGMVIAGSISSGSKMEYTVIGDTVETASKLCQSAAEGEILLGHGTYRYIKNNFDAEQVQPVSLKGKRDPVKAYKLKSLKEKNIPDAEESGRIIYSEMIGRNKELEKLEFLLHKAINGEGSIVNIVADAGLGKSRLINEFKKKELAQRVNILEGKALSTEKNIGFHPIIGILRQWAKINENDNESQGFSKLENSIKTVCNGDADEIVPFIATLMGFRLSDGYEKRIKDISGDSLKKLIQNSIQNLILKGSEAQPIIFIIEDIHWTDLSSLDLLQSLFRLAEHNKILFICTLRPNFQETGDRIISIINQRYPHFYTEIKLEPLNTENCGRLLSNLLRMDELPSQLKNSVSKSTEGNPFFIEEVLRSLIDDNIIENKEGRFYISRPAHDFTIPGSIKELLLSRIDKLDEPEKNLLKTASVIGRHFMYDILFKVSGNPADIGPRLKKLEKLELIRENTDTREREYMFKHALVQEAVYETLLTRNKQELHLKTAHAIEDLFSERIHDFYEMLAHHYGNADDKEKAEEYLIKAGERTLKTAASYEALNYFSRALKLYIQKYGSAADKEKIFMLEKNIGLSFYNRGYFRDALEHFNKALDAKGMKTERSALNETSRFIFNFILILKHLYISFPGKRSPGEKEYELFDILFKMVTAYANIDGKKMFFELLNLIRLKMGFELNGEDGFITYSVAGSLFCFSGLSFSLGKKFIDMANKHAQLHGIQEVFQNGYDETLCDYLRGNWKNFKTINEKLLDLKLKKGELIYVTYQISWALYIIICRGEYEYAEYLTRKGDEISITYDFDYGKLYMLSMKGDLELNRRNLYKAIQYYDESIELAKKLSLVSWIMGLSGKKAKALLLLNSIGPAKEALETAEKAAAEAGSLPPMFLGYLAAYRLFYHTRLFELKLSGSAGKDEMDEIKNKIEKTIKTASHMSDKVAEIKPEVERFSGIYFQMIGKNNKAIRHFENSIQSARELGAVPELGRAYLETAKFLQRHSMKLGNIEAEGYFSEAADIFIKLNLKWDLDELNRIKSDSVIQN